MAGVGNPSVIIEGAGSPHTYSLKPSQAQQLQDAKLVFWMGDELETFLVGPIENIAQSATTIKLIDTHDLKKIKFREGGMFDDALIIWAISWRWVSHVDYLKNRFEGQVLKAVNLTSKKIFRMMCEH